MRLTPHLIYYQLLHSSFNYIYKGYNEVQFILNLATVLPRPTILKAKFHELPSKKAFSMLSLDSTLVDDVAGTTRLIS